MVEPLPRPSFRKPTLQRSPVAKKVPTAGLCLPVPAVRLGMGVCVYKSKGILMRATMLKGLAVTPPVIGRISIGKVVERSGKRLPEMDDQFTITTQVQDKDGSWRLHPVDETLRRACEGKLRTIPVRLLFNDPALNMRAEYTKFDRKTGRPLCMGNGELCQRMTVGGVQSLPCPSPDHCELAEGGACKPYGRLNVVIGDDDDTGTFMFRTTGFNSIRTLNARLSYFSAVSSDLLACMPLELKLRGKSTTQSFGRAIFYVDLVVRSGMTLEEVITQAREIDARRKACGFDQAALDRAGQEGFQQGVFEDGEEDGAAVVEEFYPAGPADSAEGHAGAGTRQGAPGRAGLREKLAHKASSIAGAPT